MVEWSIRLARIRKKSPCRRGFLLDDYSFAICFGGFWIFFGGEVVNFEVLEEGELWFWRRGDGEGRVRSVGKAMRRRDGVA